MQFYKSPTPGIVTHDGSVVLQTVLLRGVEVPALVLSHLNLPVPGGRSPGVDVEGDGDTGGTGGDVHVLAGVVSTDDRR